MDSVTKIVERPILFAPHFVRAIRAGAKTQTRRTLTKHNSTVLGYARSDFWSHLLWDRPVFIDPGFPDESGQHCFSYLKVAAWNPRDGKLPDDDENPVRYRVRSLYEPGDRLWIKETWAVSWHEGPLADPFIKYRADSYRVPILHGTELFDRWRDWHGRSRKRDWNPNHWRSGRFMPRWASRTLLEINAVRPEQVQSITHDDAVAEGAFCVPSSDIQQAARIAAYEGKSQAGPVDYFRSAWESLNHGRGYGWHLNPWVWAYTFRDITKGAIHGG